MRNDSDDEHEESSSEDEFYDAEESRGLGYILCVIYFLG